MMAALQEDQLLKIKSLITALEESKKGVITIPGLITEIKSKLRLEIKRHELTLILKRNLNLS